MAVAVATILLVLRSEPNGVSMQALGAVKIREGNRRLNGWL